jgi:ParB family transcriptional regulator, chromosome partitioning protein
MYIENICLSGLNPIEMAGALADLACRLHLTQEQLAERVGKRRSTIANYLRLLTLPDEIRDGVAKGEVTMGHAKAILSQPGVEKRLQLYRRILRDRLSVREAEMAATRPGRAMGAEAEIYLRDLEEKIQRHLGLRVTARQRGRSGGVVSIEYSDFDELDGLLQQLGVGDGA